MEPTSTTFDERMRSLRSRIAETTEPAERLPLLHELSTFLCTSDAREAEEIGREALEIAEHIGDPRWIALSLRCVGNGLNTQGYHREAIECLKEAWRIQEESAVTVREKAEIARDIGRSSFQVGEGMQSIRWLDNAIELARESGDRQTLSSTLGTAGSINRTMGRYSRALQFFGEALQLFRILSYDHGVMLVLADLAEMHATIQNWEKSLELFSESLEINRRVGNRHNMAVVLKTKADVHTNLSQYDIALEHLERAIAIFGELGDQSQRTQCLMGLGHVHEVMGELDKAEELYRSGLAQFEELDIPSGRSLALYNIGMVMTARKRWADARDAFQASLEVNDGTRNNSIRRAVLKALGPVFEALGCPRQALEHYKECMSIEYSMHSGTVQELLVRLESGVRAAGSHDEFPQGDLDELEKRLQRGSDEAAHFSSSLAESERFLREVQEKIRSLGEHLSVDPVFLQTLIAEIDRNIDSVEAWKSLERQIRDLNVQFLETLGADYPGLTSTEIRVCLLIRIGLANKEIAAVLDISDRTVNTHRTNIRKKLGLERRDNLFSWLTRC